MEVIRFLVCPDRGKPNDENDSATENATTVFSIAQIRGRERISHGATQNQGMEHPQIDAPP